MASEYEVKVLDMVKGLDLSVGKNDVEITYSFGEVIRMEVMKDDTASIEAVDGGEEC